jgi:hypothetical protein
MIRLITVMLCMAHASALECNISFAKVQIDVESITMCDYANYHMFSLVFFGIGTCCFGLYTCMLILCGAKPKTVGKRAFRTFVLFVFAIGVDVAVGIFLALLPIVCLYVCVAMRNPHYRLPLFRLDYQLFVGRVVPVVDMSVHRVFAAEEAMQDDQLVTLSEIVIEPIIHLGEESPAAPPRGIAFELTELSGVDGYECPICFESNGSGWLKTECGHTFHTDCISRWWDESESCPCCRKV